MANVLENVGARTIEHLDYVGSLNIQWWATLRAIVQSLPFVGNRYRWKAAVRQMLEIGVDAIPMVSLMAVCTGFIFAMQGASELRRFGALRYVVDLVAVGFTCELGRLMTAIAVMSLAPWVKQRITRCKAEASRKSIPLEAELAEVLLNWKLQAPYPKPGDWVFASPHKRGKQP